MKRLGLEDPYCIWSAAEKVALKTVALRKEWTWDELLDVRPSLVRLFHGARARLCLTDHPRHVFERSVRDIARVPGYLPQRLGLSMRNPANFRYVRSGRWS